ncbi:MAG: peptidoglycan DD-metalloendopeptidase family protein [Bacteroidales bacterium]|nr:peptidoglycan DD-metalloendopeptidase family protein [Bacteroidales bacterium]
MATLIIFTALLVACRENAAADDISEEMQGLAKEVVTDRFGIPRGEYTVVEGKVGTNDYFSTVLNSFGVPHNQVHNLVSKSRGFFDANTFKTGHSYYVYLPAEGEAPDYFVYQKDNITAVVFDLRDTLAVSLVNKQVDVEQKYVEVTIASSLWNDIQDAGASPLLAIKLSEIYAWSVDFFGLQKGDVFEVLYNEHLCEGEPTDIGEVWYSTFTSGGKSIECLYFEEEGTSNRYWNAEGESMRKSFLKSPLKYFSRISSGFTYARRHPITRVVRPHTGVDYAAPTGTPVLTIGDGVVIEKGYKGGGGNTVKIRHNSVYTTAYLHLSRYASGLKVGSRVSQGQVIGYVGSTGMSTGPHLDFRVWKNGTPINPLKMESPPAEPIKEAHKEKFEASRDSLRHLASNFVVRKYYRDYVLDLL